MKPSDTSRTTRNHVAVSSLLVGLVACSIGSPESTARSDAEQITDIRSMVQRPDGRFDVTCTDGTSEVVSADDIAKKLVCNGGSITRGVVIYGRSDSCDDGRAVTRVTETTDCSTLSATEAAWSVKVDGQCVDIGDTNVRAACLDNQPGVKQRLILYGRSDTCDPSRILMRLDKNADCAALSTNEAVWSVKKNGQCVDIGDTNVRAACIGYL